MVAWECDNSLKQETQNKQSAHFNTGVRQSAPDICQGQAALDVKDLTGVVFS